jgi:acetyltransferase-like isoleucine patch superfamily enzyme
MHKNYLKLFLRYINIVGLKNIINFRNLNIERGAKIDARSGKIYIGKSVKLGRYASIYTQGGNIIIGNNVSIRQSTILYGYGNIQIGDGVRIGPNVVITSHNHGFDGVNSVSNLISTGEEVIIGDNCWIGANCVLLSGVRLLKGSVVGAGTVLPRGEYRGKVIVKNKVTYV